MSEMKIFCQTAIYALYAQRRLECLATGSGQFEPCTWRRHEAPVSNRYDHSASHRLGLAIRRAADTLSKQIAARTELYQIQTLTLSDQQFLKGDTGGKPVTITGQLRIAQGSGRLPVVVLQHGSGYAANIDVWSRELNELGISTFALDNFTGRGLAEVNTNQALLGRLNFILDDYRALEVLASHPRVDPNGLY